MLKCDILDQRDDGQDGGRFEAYTAAVAFNGNYKVTVKQAFGKPIGGTAQLHIYKFKGTAEGVLRPDYNRPEQFPADRDQARRRLANGTRDRHR